MARTIANIHDRNQIHAPAHSGGLLHSGVGSSQYQAAGSVTSYSLSAPGGVTDVGTAATLTITLGTGTLASSVTITPAASNGDGVFSPASVTLTNATRSATVSYTPALAGARNITTTNSGSLTNPAATAFVAGFQIGSTPPLPAQSNTPALGWSWRSVPGNYWSDLLRACDTDDVSTYNAATMARFAGDSSGQYLMLSWDPDIVGGGEPYAGMPVNHVRGDTPYRTMVLYDNGDGAPPYSDPGPVPYAPNTAIQNWPGDWTNNQIPGTVKVTNGSVTVTGTSTNFLSGMTSGFPQPTVGDTFTFADARPPVFYTIAAIASNTSLTLDRAYTGSTVTGAPMRGPWNRPPLNVDEPAGNDHHVLCLIRDEATGLPSKLYEDYQVYSPDRGTTWYSTSSSKFNLVTGAQRQDGWTSTTAGGTPLYPFLLTYEQALNGTIDHPLRGIIGFNMGMTARCVWPATCSAYAWGGTDPSIGVLPCGARLRLRAAWWTANRASYSAINRNILDALKTYGMLVNDFTWPNYGLCIDGVSDPRWLKADLTALRGVPVSAFEVCKFDPQVSLTGPTSGAAGVSRTHTLSYIGPAYNNSFATEVYLRWTKAGGSPVDVGGVNITPSTRSVNISYTPPSAGTYTIVPITYGVQWLLPQPMTFTAT